MKSTLRCLLGLFLFEVCFGAICFGVCPGGLHQTSLAGYALSPDKTYIAAVADDGTLFRWDVASGKRTQLLECIKVEIFDHSILFSLDSRRLAVVNDDAILVFDTSTGHSIARLAGTKLKNLKNIVFSGNGRRLAASHDDGVIVWDVASGAETMSADVKINRMALALNRDGSRLSLGGDDIQVWNVDEAKVARKIRLGDGEHPESLTFAHDDRWIVADIATALPFNEKQHFVEHKYKLVIWDIPSGAAVKSLSGPTNELRSPLAFVSPRTVLAVDYDYLRTWNLDSGELTETWETPSGRLSGDGDFLLRGGGAPGGLELLRIGSPDASARSFEYRSPLCAEKLTGNVEANTVKFEGLAMFNGRNEDNEWWSGSSYIAQDCTPASSTHSKFKSRERAEQVLEIRAAQATQILEKRSVQKPSAAVFLGERIVGRFANKHSVYDTFRILWVEDNYLCEISSSSLPLALAMERQRLQGSQKK
jgi:WD40 repeat protein